MRRKCLVAVMALLQILSVQCSRSGPAIQPETTDEKPKPTVVTKFTVKGEMRSCEIFIYRCDALGSLAAHWTWMPPDTRYGTTANGTARNATVANGTTGGKAIGKTTELSAFIRLEKGSYSAVAVCNACAPINPAAVERRSAFDNFEYGYADEDPSVPVGSAACSFEAGGEVVLEPGKLLSSVHIVSVSRQFSGELERTVLEQPCVYLRNVPAKAELLREKDFHPSEFIGEGVELTLLYSRLGSDLGYNELHPGITLYCYPNDAIGNDIAAPHTRVALEGRLNGIYRCWKADLGPIGRGVDVYVEFILYDENSCSCRIY